MLSPTPPLLLRLLLLLPSLPLLLCSSPPPPSPPSPPLTSDQVSFRPSVAIVIGIFSIMFSLTFLLLMYAKFCHSPPHRHRLGLPSLDPASALLDRPRSSGLDSSLIAALPFFRFSALKGPTAGLDCAVCLSTFLPADLLRLLPKCKHAFHLACVDAWLLAHSTCPLCRARVDPHDATSFFLSSSSRALFRDPSSEPPELDLYLERESSSSGFVGSSQEPGKPPKGAALDAGLHRVKHRVVVSDVVFKNRWSDLTSADLFSLRSEMLGHASSTRFSTPSAAAEPRAFSADGALTVREEMERRRAVDRKAMEMEIVSPQPTLDPAYSARPTSSLLVPGEKRCVSEITNLPRFHGAEELEGGKARRLWLPIAKRTVQWLHGRERRPTPEV